jgi:hypothetical protein
MVTLKREENLRFWIELVKEIIKLWLMDNNRIKRILNMKINQIRLMNSWIHMIREYRMLSIKQEIEMLKLQMNNNLNG